MEQHITWAPIFVFLTALAGYALIEHLRTRRKQVRRRRSDFRRMESPAARARRRAAQRSTAVWKQA